MIGEVLHRSRILLPDGSVLYRKVWSNGIVTLYRRRRVNGKLVRLPIGPEVWVGAEVSYPTEIV